MRPFWALRAKQPRPHRLTSRVLPEFSDYDLTLLNVHAEKRQAEAARIRDKYPDRIPVSMHPSPCPWCGMSCPSEGINILKFTFCALQVIVEKAEKSDIPDIDKKK